MNDKIFLIITGCYSDWEVQGFVETEEEARKIVAFRNARDAESSKPFCNYDAYYIDASRIKLSVGEENAKIAVLFKVHLANKNNPALMPYESREFYSASDDFLFESGIRPFVKHIEVDGGIWRTAMVYVFMQKEDKDKIFKVARDTLYEHLSTLNGIS